MNKTQAASFWIVWCPTSDRSPKHRHSSYSAALAEATRLAHANPGSEFVVLEAMAALQVCDVVKTVFAGNMEEIPF